MANVLTIEEAERLEDEAARIDAFAERVARDGDDLAASPYRQQADDFRHRAAKLRKALKGKPIRKETRAAAAARVVAERAALEADRTRRVATEREVDRRVAVAVASLPACRPIETPRQTATTRTAAPEPTIATPIRGSQTGLFSRANPRTEKRMKRRNPLLAPAWMSREQQLRFIALPDADARMAYLDYLSRTDAHARVRLGLRNPREPLTTVSVARLLTTLRSIVIVYEEIGQVRVEPRGTASSDLLSAINRALRSGHLQACGWQYHPYGRMFAVVSRRATSVG